MKNSPFLFTPTFAIKSIMLAALFFNLNATVRAAGVLDPTFGTNGRVATTFGGDSVYAKAVAIQPDGKILVVGDAFRLSNPLATHHDVVLLRYNPNGTLDTSFGEGGKVFAATSPLNEDANAVALQSDGKIVVGGTLYSPVTLSNDFLFVRFNVNGTLDTTFGNNGVTAINQGATDIINAVAIQADGKIVGVGKTSDGDRAAVVRLNLNGSLDTTFSGGLVYLGLPGFSSESFAKVALLADGRILAGGNGSVSVPHSGGSSFLVALNPNGSLSSDFGTNGIVVFWDGFLTPGFDFEVLPDGKILAVADRTYRFFSNGTRDTSFTGRSPGTELAVRSDGRFIVAGSFFSSFETNLYASDGRFIGRAKNLPATEITAQPDDKIIFIGSTQTEFIVIRLIAVTSQATRIADYDNDDKTDIAVLRQSNSTLYVSRSSGSGFTGYNSGEASFEVRRVIPERFGSGLPFVYWRSSGNIIGSAAAFCGTNGTGSRQCTQWGMLGDVPVGGDYDGDQFTDYTVYRPSNGVWYVRQSSGNNQFTAVQWGTNDDKPVPADYDYDGITDYAIYRPSTGTWWIRRSSDGANYAIQFGAASDIPLTGDYDGDGQGDFVVFRPSSGVWYQFLTTEGFKAVQFGVSTDIPVPGDYDGDGKHDFAVFRQGIWYLLQSTKGFAAVQFGAVNDVPVSVRYDQ